MHRSKSLSPSRVPDLFPLEPFPEELMTPVSDTDDGEKVTPTSLSKESDGINETAAVDNHRRRRARSACAKDRTTTPRPMSRPSLELKKTPRSGSKSKSLGDPTKTSSVARTTSPKAASSTAEATTLKKKDRHHKRSSMGSTPTTGGSQRRSSIGNGSSRRWRRNKSNSRLQAERLVDSMDLSSESTSSIQRVRMQKQNYERLRNELTRQPSIPDLVARMQTTTSQPAEKADKPKRRGLPRSASVGVATMKKQTSPREAFQRSASLPIHHFALNNSDSSCSSQCGSTGQWTCVCKEVMDGDMTFCGVCGTKKTWECKGCSFDRNLNRYVYCGKCGTPRKDSGP